MKKGQVRNEAVKRGFVGSAIDAFVRGYEYAESNKRKHIEEVQKVKEEVCRTVDESVRDVRQEQKPVITNTEQLFDKLEHKEKEDSRTVHTRVEGQKEQRKSDLSYF